ncbi:MAG: acetyl esterase/lipase [Paraglaciecola sp.]|jgi:acetyl esterase/lipase
MRLIYARMCLALIFLCASGNAKEIAKPPSLSNVSYSSVTDLEFTNADFKLSYGQDPLQYGLLWLPPDAPEVDTTAHSHIKNQSDFPLIVLIHGGCWLNAYDIKHTYALSTALAAAGYAVWSLEYRRTGDEGGGWPGSLTDVRAGISYIHKLKTYPVDLSKVVLTGHSAGGHLALLAGAKNQSVLAVIGLAAITDIEKYSRGDNSCESAIRQFMAGSYDERTREYDSANPLKQTLHINNLLLQGDADVIVPMVQATQSKLPFKILEGAGHFDWIHPHTRAFETLILSLQDIFK